MSNALEGNKELYSDCQHITRKKPDVRITEVPWETNIPKDHTLKVNKYYNLKNELTKNGYVVSLYAVEVGARGLPAKSLYNLLKDLGLTRTAAISILEQVSKAALAGSYQIWLCRENNSNREEIAKEIGRNFRTVPAFEKGLFDYVYTQHYSMERNQLLQCRWQQYKHNIEKRVFAPFQFPGSRDLHFYNGCIRFMPSESTFRVPEHRMKLKPGPGVDFRGQVPIPQELLMKRGKIEKEDGGVQRKVKQD